LFDKTNASVNKTNALVNKANALVNKTNIFVKPNEQCRACSNIIMTRIGNRQHGALGEVERQNALFEERKKERTDSAKRKNAHAPPSAQFLTPCAFHSRRTT